MERLTAAGLRRGGCRDGLGRLGGCVCVLVGGGVDGFLVTGMYYLDNCLFSVDSADGLL